METKQLKLEKERQKALGDLLISECRAKTTSIDTIDTILKSGADINFKNSKPLYWASKLHKFELVKFLIEHGALNSEIAKTYISSMCDYKGFNDEKEPDFFAILDVAHTKAGDYMSLFTPYINSMAVSGRLDKIRQLQERYFLTEYEIVGCIYIRIIFEMVLRGNFEMLEFIEKHKKWMTQETFDLAVGSGEIEVLDFMIQEGEYYQPTDKAVAQAVYEGYFDVLNRLIACGFQFSKKPIFLEKACRASYSKGTESFVYLMQNGYCVSDTYNGKSILEHAMTDKNRTLLDYLKASEVC